MNRVLALVECDAAEPGKLMPASEAERLAVVLKALADPVRIRLLRLVAEAPDTTACACHLPTALGISQPTLSHHLKKLADAGLLVREQRGRWAHYRLESTTLGPVRGYLDDVLSDRRPAWPDR